MHFTPDEWALIEKRKIAIGMREGAMVCSWGDPNSTNRTLTTGAERRQYVYGDRTFVYTTNGTVDAIQDGQ